MASWTHHSLLAALPDAAVALDAAGTVLELNDRAAHLFRASRAALIGHAAEPLLPFAELRRVADGAGRGRIEGRRANAVPVVLEVAVGALDDDGGPPRWLCILRELNQEALVEETQRYLDVAFDQGPIGKALFNCDGEYLRVNPALCTLLGRPAEDLLGRRDQELTHPDDRQSDVDVAWRVLAGELSSHQCEKRFVRPDGSTVWVLANLTFVRDEAGRPLSWVGHFQDITARRVAEDRLRAAEERFRLAFDHAPVGIALVSPEGHWLRVNHRVCEMLGYEEAALLATTFQDLTHHEDLDADLEQVAAMLAGAIDTYEMEKRYLRADGRVIWALLSVSLVRDGDGRPLYFVSQLQDIEERKRAHGELEHLARTDELTGTLNRRAWDAELARAIVEAGESRRPLAIALIDLNGFKEVNDRHGHDAGDRVLKEAAAAWQAQLRPSDALARLGGDEFAVLLPQCAEEHLGHIVRRLKDAVPHAAGCGVGVAVWVDGESGEALIRRADDALYMDKSIGARRVL